MHGGNKVKLKSVRKLSVHVYNRILEYGAEFYRNFNVSINTILDHHKYVDFIVYYFEIK